jgi:glycosyltransferase involved in cell wall biosynthesis
MKKTILFLDQQSWLGGAQRVLDYVFGSLGTDFKPVVAFPDKGPFRLELEKSGVETLTIPIGSYRSGSKSYLEMVGFAVRSVFCGIQLAATIRKGRVDIVYINGPRCLLAGVFAAWLTGRPTIFHLQLILNRRSELFLATRLSRHVSRIIACSQAAAQSLLNADTRLSGKIEVLYNPVPARTEPVADRTYINRRATTPYFTLGMVGRITEVKGQHLLLKAAGKLPPEVRNKIRILFVGAPAPANKKDTRYAEDLRTIALQYDLTEKIMWAGYQTDLRSWYASMDVLVQSAVWAEAMGLVILEALQQGIPVIAARIGGIPEIIKEGTNGLLVAPGDEDALCRALHLFIQDRSLREHLQLGAQSRLDDQFTLKYFSPKIRALVCNLCNVTDSKKNRAPDEKSAAWK